jgi:uncharacterized membrane protein (DUF4010 family)
MNAEQQVFFQLGTALAIGLLIGLERGWKERETEDSDRIAGVRTYGLIGLLGGAAALLAESHGPLVIGLAFVALTGVLATVYALSLERGSDNVGITSLVASLLTFVLGALAGQGELAVAAASAVVTTLLLGYKPILHRWVGALKGSELRAVLKLLLISVVLLPVLPNRGYGPWQALNPYTIWWLVVLVATISFVGYFAVKIGGTRKGTLFTGLFGGLASSTALTVHFSRLGRGADAALGGMLAAGILLACGTMFPRMLLIAGMLNTSLFRPLLVPTFVMACVLYLPALWYWYSGTGQRARVETPLKNPLELKTAFGFGVLLTLVMLFGTALQNWFGDTGVLALSVASGIADVDAITLSLARMTQDDLTLRVAALGIVLAAAVNNLAKGVMASLLGGRALAVRVGVPLLASAVCGLLTVWLLAR